MTPVDARRELDTLLRSQVPVLIVETRDEARARELVVSVAATAYPPLPVFVWMVTEGLRRVDVDLGTVQRFNAAPGDVLATIRDSTAGGIYVLLDFHPYLDDPLHVRLLKDIGLGYDDVPRTVVLVSHEVDVPAELDHLTARFDLALPGREERRVIVDEVVRAEGAARGAPVLADEASVDQLVESLAGLSRGDTRRLARSAVGDDGAITAGTLPAVARGKYELVRRGGVLGLEQDVAGAEELAGMSGLKEWLLRRRPAFDGTAPDLDPPKGVLLLGVQGCGKSLAAKVAASLYGVPLLRLDLGELHDKYVGESERKLRESLATADVMAPCVMWVDEIEKGLTGDDNGPSQRLLGTFLTWLAEKRTRVFVVATANDISQLPPELVRKGRFDEIFFVDLPGPAVRSEVLRIHARRRRVPLTEEDLAALVTASAGHSGAEIEQAVVAAAYTAHADGLEVTAEHVLAELRATRPLSVVMAERIAELRAWAAQRTVPAG